jgi:hypothetical protein
VLEIPIDTGSNDWKAKKVEPPPRPLERFAVLLNFSGSGGNGAKSAELQEFLASRQALRPGSVQMVLVIHETSV